MMHLSRLVFLLCVWFPFKTLCNEEKPTQDGNTDLLLQDFKVKLSPGLINITWNCNITNYIEKYKYKIGFKMDLYDYLNMPKCSYVRKVYKDKILVLHEGLTIQLKVYDGEKHLYTKYIEEKFMPDGKPNSAAENFTCKIYNVYIMNCSWAVGKETPEDTQYTLVLRQSDVYVTCQDYRKDSFGRQVGCVFKRPNISFDKFVYVEISGLSNQTSIQFFDAKYKPIFDVILDPPRNITLTYQSDELEIKWQKPETYARMLEKNFLYNININNGKLQRFQNGSEENILKSNEFYPNEKVNVSMRVKFSGNNFENQEWSAWSKPQIIGYNSMQLTTHHILIVLGVGTAIILIALIVLCYRFRIWKKLFPQVPKPSMKLFEEVERNGKALQKESDIEIPFVNKMEDDDFICSFVVEMAENLK